MGLSNQCLSQSQPGWMGQTPFDLYLYFSPFSFWFHRAKLVSKFLPSHLRIASLPVCILPSLPTATLRRSQHEECYVIIRLCKADTHLAVGEVRLSVYSRPRLRHSWRLKCTQKRLRRQCRWAVRPIIPAVMAAAPCKLHVPTGYMLPVPDALDRGGAYMAY